MKPREIEVHIEELVLHGFDPRSRWSIADALGSELSGLLTERGIPPAWQASPDRIDAGRTRANEAKPTVIGEQIARAVYKGGSR
jgi:hypothetical protein